MKHSLNLLCPGYPQWHYGYQLKSYFFSILGFGFLVLGLFGPFFLDDPSAQYDLVWGLLAQSPSQANLLRFVGLGYFVLTIFASAGDAVLNQPKPYLPSDDETQFFKEILKLWLADKTTAARQKLEGSLVTNSRDPWLHYLLARFFTLEKKPLEAQQALNRCQQLDYGTELTLECAQLQKEIQGETK